jgi:serine/threonine-protein kinase HipA
MTGSSELIVRLHGMPVGVLRRRGVRSSFVLLDSYLGSYPRPVLGQVFEERPRLEFVSPRSIPSWFQNLLPEPGPLRAFLLRELSIRDDDLSLLEALGHDLPGAVTVHPQDGDVVRGPVRPRLGHEDGEPTVREFFEVRFSMAGVQLKLSMVRERNTVRLPGRDERGDLLVKFPGAMPELPLNEFVVMSLAARCGLNVPELGLMGMDDIPDLPKTFADTDGVAAYWIRRFDRTAEGPVHIEDFNQILGQPVDKKYEGLSEEKLALLIATLCGDEDFWEYLRRLVFNIAVGNEDSHLKNWSVSYPDRVNPRLAPLYDVISTVVMPGLERGHALKISKDRWPGSFTLASIRRVAAKAGKSEDAAEAAALDLLAAIKEHEPHARAAVSLPAGYWERLDDYRRTVPLLRTLA